MAVLALIGFVWVAISVAVRPVAASGETAAAGHDAGVVHVYIELFQLFAGIIAVGTSYLAVQTIRGGHIEWAFYSLTAGVVTFLVQRLWHSVHEFGFLPLPEIGTQSLFLLATVLIAVGFGQTYQVMQPTE